MLGGVFRPDPGAALHFSKALLILSSTHPCMSGLIRKGITFHFRRVHSIMQPNIINNPICTLTCFPISCRGSRSACIPADATNRGNGLETAKVASRGSGGGVSPPSHSWVFLIICEDQQCSRMHKGRDLTARSSG